MSSCLILPPARLQVENRSRNKVHQKLLAPGSPEKAPTTCHILPRPAALRPPNRASPAGSAAPGTAGCTQQRLLAVSIPLGPRGREQLPGPHWLRTLDALCNISREKRLHSGQWKAVWGFPPLGRARTRLGWGRDRRPKAASTRLESRSPRSPLSQQERLNLGVGRVGVGRVSALRRPADA